MTKKIIVLMYGILNKFKISVEMIFFSFNKREGGGNRALGRPIKGRLFSPDKAWIFL